MADKYMHITNDDAQNTPCVELNKWLKRLDIQMNEPINQNSLKDPKVVEPTIKKTLS